AAVELHALDHFELGLERFRLLDRDHALVADLLHGVGEEAADLGIAIGRDGRDLSDLIVRGDVLGVFLEILDHGLDRDVDAALEVHRVHAGRYGLGAFLDDGLRQHGCGGGAVAGDVGGLARDLAHHLGAHVLELVLELDLLGDGDAVLGDPRGAEGFLQHHVAALGAERHPYGIGENVDAAQHLVAGIGREFYFLGCHCIAPARIRCALPRPEDRPVTFRGWVRGDVELRDEEMDGPQAALRRVSVSTSTPMMSLSFMIRYSTPSILTSVPDHLPNSTRSPALTSIGISLPVSSRPPGPTATTSPCCGFSFAVSGMIMPPAGLSSASVAF